MILQGSGGAVLKSVQRGSTAVTLSSVLVDITITAVDLTKSFVVISVDNNGTGPTQICGASVRARLTSATNLKLTRLSAGGGSDMQVNWEVVEYQSGVVVQQINSTMASGVLLDTAITAVNLARTFLVSGGWESNDTVAAATLTTWMDNLPRIKLTSTTNLRVERDASTGSSLNITTYVVEFL